MGIVRLWALSGWFSVGQDHIHFTIGRQSFNLKQLENATSAFKHLLTGESKQPTSQQGAFLREYLFVYKVTQQGLSACIPLPFLVTVLTRKEETILARLHLRLIGRLTRARL